MANKSNDLKIIKGDPKILLVTPYGVKSEPREYWRTFELAEEICRHLGCYTVITSKKGRKSLDLSKISQAKKHDLFIPTVREVLDSNDKTLVVWIHGIMEPYRKLEQYKMRSKIRKLNLPYYGKEAAKVWNIDWNNLYYRDTSKRINCLVGYGQPENLTAKDETVSAFCFLLQCLLFQAYPTRNDLEDFRGAGSDSMNQWFRQQKEYNSFDKVESIQLAFSRHCRHKDNFARTAELVATVLSNLTKPSELDTILAGIKRTFRTLSQPEKDIQTDDGLEDISELEDLNPDEKSSPEIVKELSGKNRNKEIRFLEGTNNIIAIAPHESTSDDENVNVIVEELHSKLGCYAVINEKYKRKKVNLNDISDVIDKGIESEFLEPIKKFKDSIVDKP